MLDNNFYVYRHIRPDTDEVFYIGKGNNLDNRVPLYGRAKKPMCNKRRSEFWEKVVNKNNGKFEWEIMYECDTEYECNKKEIEFIRLYGRKDLGIGTLVNLTDGGDGQLGVKTSQSVLNKRSERMKGERHPYFGKLPPNSKKVINVTTGEIFNAISEASEKLNFKKGLLEAYLSGRLANKTEYVYLKIYEQVGAEKCASLINQGTRLKGKPKQVIDISNNKKFDSVKEAATCLSISYNYLREMLQGRAKNKTNIRYI